MERLKKYLDDDERSYREPIQEKWMRFLEIESHVLERAERGTRRN